MKPWLEEEEVIELTQKERPSAQLRVLKSLGYSVRFRPDGSFIVPRDQFFPESQGKKEFKLDFSGLGDGSQAA